MLRHRAFESGRFDLGNMTQAVWSTAHGDVLSVTDVHGEQISRLGSHFDPILALLAPLWWLWPDPELLLVVQAVAVASGALPVFWLARKHLGADWPAAALALAYLLSAPVQWLTVSDFHPVALACPLLLFAWWHLDEGRLWAFALLAAAAIATKEHVGLAVAAMGVWYAVRHRAPRAGAAIALAAGVCGPARSARRRPPLRARRHLGLREPLRVAVARRPRPLLPRLPPAAARAVPARRPARAARGAAGARAEPALEHGHADLREDALRGHDRSLRSSPRPSSASRGSAPASPTWSRWRRSPEPSCSDRSGASRFGPTRTTPPRAVAWRSCRPARPSARRTRSARTSPRAVASSASRCSRRRSGSPSTSGA